MIHSAIRIKHQLSNDPGETTRDYSLKIRRDRDRIFGYSFPKQQYQIKTWKGANVAVALGSIRSTDHGRDVH